MGQRSLADEGFGCQRESGVAIPVWAESSGSACVDQGRIEPIVNTAPPQGWHPAGVPEMPDSGGPAATALGSPSEDRGLSCPFRSPGF